MGSAHTLFILRLRRKAPMDLVTARIDMSGGLDGMDTHIIPSDSRGLTAHPGRLAATRCHKP